MKGPDKSKAADKGKATAVIDRSKAGDMNMMVLKRIDPQTEEVGFPLCNGMLCLCTLVALTLLRPADTGHSRTCLPVPHERG
jgi:hypothetical protein